MKQKMDFLLILTEYFTNLINTFYCSRLTAKQMTLLLKSERSPFIRCAALLCLRYTCPPTEIWAWFRPYLSDDESFVSGLRGSAAETTIGEYVFCGIIFSCHHITEDSTLI